MYSCSAEKKCSESGFSLIEIAILLTVFGLLIVPIIHVYNLEQTQYKLDKTQGSLQYVRDALVKYSLENGRYPFPAPRNVAEGNAAFGVEAAGPFVACVGGDVNPCRAGVALVGDLPFKTIGINIEHIVDGYGGKLTYAVTEVQTATGTFSDILPTDAGIDVRRRDNNDEPQTDDNAHFAIISHGEDNSGAFSLGGALINGCPSGGATNRDSINCDNADDIFTTNSDFTDAGVYERAQYLAPGATHYDDFVYFATTAQGYIWTYAVGQVDMRSRNPGNTRIGSLPNTVILRPQRAVAKLEVMGDVSMDQLIADRLCPTDPDPDEVDPLTTCPDPGSVLGLNDDIDDPIPPNVFDPAVIAFGPKNPENYGLSGDGIYCGGQALQGIANSDEDCASFFPTAFTSTIADCPPGRFPVGIDASGQLDCILP